MKVTLKEAYEDIPAGNLGEAIYFRYNDEGKLLLGVMFYGYPGILLLDPAAVDSVS